MRLTWNRAMVAELTALYPTTTAAEIAARMGVTERQVFTKAQHLGLRKSREWISARARQVMANPQHAGRQTQFRAGHETWNKGLRGIDIGGKATRFKPGQKPHSWRPIGHALVFRDGNKANLDINNLELITRRELMARNTVHRLPKDVALAVQMLGALRRQINNRETPDHENHG